MDAKELADKVVALGVGIKRPPLYKVSPLGTLMQPDRFVRDWQVAGSLMEKCTDLHYDTMLGVTVVIAWANKGLDSSEEVEVGESLPLAITEACIAALEGQTDE